MISHLYYDYLTLYIWTSSYPRENADKFANNSVVFPLFVLKMFDVFASNFSVLSKHQSRKGNMEELVMEPKVCPGHCQFWVWNTLCGSTRWLCRNRDSSFRGSGAETAARFYHGTPISSKRKPSLNEILLSRTTGWSQISIDWFRNRNCLIIRNRESLGCFYIAILI